MLMNRTTPFMVPVDDANPAIIKNEALCSECGHCFAVCEEEIGVAAKNERADQQGNEDSDDDVDDGAEDMMVLLVMMIYQDDDGVYVLNYGAKEDMRKDI